MGWVVNDTPRPLYPRERPGTHCTGGWVGPRAGLDGNGKSPSTGIRSPDRSAFTLVICCDVSICRCWRKATWIGHKWSRNICKQHNIILLCVRRALVGDLTEIYVAGWIFKEPQFVVPTSSYMANGQSTSSTLTDYNSGYFDNAISLNLRAMNF
jgi:hypothetical protein